MNRSILFMYFGALLFGLSINYSAGAQQYKLRQASSMAGMKSETTIYVKGMRKRTEGGGYAGMPQQVVTIEQCDLQRTIKINDKKKLYYIEPFVQLEEEEEDGKPATKPKAVPTSNKKDVTRKGGTIYNYYNITDTGERKKMFGFTARHVWTTQKMKPSADACMMKDSMIIRTDGWYIDLPQFNCPVMGSGGGGGYAAMQKMECQDRFVSKRSGKGRLGFPLIETRTMIMGGQASQSDFKSTLETLEFSTVKLDSMLFEIPPGYTQVQDEEELQDKMDYAQLARQSAAGYSNSAPSQPVSETKKSGVIRIGVFAPGTDEQLEASVLQTHLVNLFTNDNVEAVAITNDADIAKYNCDYTLNTEFTKVKQSSKVGSLLKAIKNTDPGASTSFNIEAALKLTNVADGKTKLEQKVNGKFDGKANDAAMKALEKAGMKLLNEL